MTQRVKSLPAVRETQVLSLGGDSLEKGMASLVVLVVKTLPANAGDIETWVLSLDWEDPQEEGMATHSTILAWRIPGTEDPGGLQALGSQ